MSEQPDVPGWAFLPEENTSGDEEHEDLDEGVESSPPPPAQRPPAQRTPSFQAKRTREGAVEGAGRPQKRLRHGSQGESSRRSSYALQPSSSSRSHTGTEAGPRSAGPSKPTSSRTTDRDTSSNDDMSSSMSGPGRQVARKTTGGGPRKPNPPEPQDDVEVTYVTSGSSSESSPEPTPQRRTATKLQTARKGTGPAPKKPLGQVTGATQPRPNVGGSDSLTNLSWSAFADQLTQGYAKDKQSSASTAGSSRRPSTSKPPTSTSAPAAKAPVRSLTAESRPNVDKFLATQKPSKDTRSLNEALGMTAPGTSKGKKKAEGEYKFHRSKKDNRKPQTWPNLDPKAGSSIDNAISVDSDDEPEPVTSAPPRPAPDLPRRKVAVPPTTASTPSSSTLPSKPDTPAIPDEADYEMAPPPPLRKKQQQPSASSSSAPVSHASTPPLPRRPPTAGGLAKPSPLARNPTSISHQRPSTLQESPIRRHTLPAPIDAQDSVPAPPVTRIATPATPAGDHQSSVPPMSPGSPSPSPPRRAPLVGPSQGSLRVFQAPPSSTSRSSFSYSPARATSSGSGFKVTSTVAKPKVESPSKPPAKGAQGPTRGKVVLQVDSDGSIIDEIVEGGDDDDGDDNLVRSSSDSSSSDDEVDAEPVQQESEEDDEATMNELDDNNARDVSREREDALRREILEAEDGFADNEDEDPEVGEVPPLFTPEGTQEPDTEALPGLFSEPDEDVGAGAPLGPALTSSPDGDDEHDSDEDMEVDAMVVGSRDVSQEIDDVAEALGSQKLKTTSPSEGAPSSRPESQRSSPGAEEPAAPNVLPTVEVVDEWEGFYASEESDHEAPTTSKAAVPAVPATAATPTPMLSSGHTSESEDPLASIPAGVIAPVPPATNPGLTRSSSASTTSTSSGPKTPDPTTALAKPSSTKTYGGLPVISFESYKDNYEPDVRYSSDLDRERRLYDYINHFSLNFRTTENMPNILRAVMARNTMDDEPLAPEIEIINDIDPDQSPTPPWEFYYTNRLFHGEGVPPPDVKNLKGCGCIGKCDPKNLKGCSCVAKQREYSLQEANSGFAYDKHKRLKKDYMGYPIFECNDLCGCDPDCYNRVVQHGRTVQISIKKTLNKGWGVFAGSKKIPQGTFLGIYSGELLTAEENTKRGTYYEDWGTTYLFGLDFHNVRTYYRKLQGKEPVSADDDESSDEDEEFYKAIFTVDAFHAGNFTRFLNNSCEPNCRTFPCYINEGNMMKPLLAVFAYRDIEPYQEICFNYAGEGYDDDEDSGGPATEEAVGDSSLYRKCECGAKKCTGRLFKAFG